VRNLVWIAVLLTTLGAAVGSDNASEQLKQADQLFQRGKSSEALTLLRTLATQGSAGALYRLGVAYEIGRGVPQSYSDAWNCYSQAAEKDVLVAIHKQGLFHHYGWHVEKSEREAKKCWLRAAERGFAPSQYLLATHSLSITDANEQPDDNVAMYWLHKAADQNLPEAVYLLGILYENGLMTRKDVPLGYSLVTWSLHHRFRIEPWLHSADPYRRMKGKLSPAEKVRAQDLLAQLKTSDCCAVIY
jgi:TPR repeat protein